MNTLSVYPLPGISYTHDPNACLVTDQGVVYAAEEERFLREQHAIGHFPQRAAMVGLQHLGLFSGGIDQFVTTSMEGCRRRVDYHHRLQFAREQLHVPAKVGSTCVPHHLAHSAGAVPVDLTDRNDDLLLIKGLGPKLVEQLRALGVTSFAQIAAWDDAEIDRIDAQLGRFQGRIRRDDWPAQARLLAAGDTSGYEAKFGKL